MPGDEVILIVGGGLAGARAAEGARESGFDGRLVIVGAEDTLPYIRPPLSKEFLIGKSERGSFDVHPADWYTEQRVELLLDRRVAAIDPAAHTVDVERGRRAALRPAACWRPAPHRVATAARARTSPACTYLRTVGDSTSCATPSPSEDAVS